MQSNIAIKNEVVEGEIITPDTMAKTTSANAETTIFVTATIQIINPDFDNTFNQQIITEQLSIIQWQQQEIAKLNKKLNKKVSIDPIFVSTKDAAMYINVDPSFLTKRQGSAFKLGVHFFKPTGESIVRWSLEALEEWIRVEYIDHEVDEELAELLERR